MKVKNIIPLVISLSSFFAKIKEITGDGLSKVQSITIGRVLKTTCWSNIPIFVPNKIETYIWKLKQDSNIFFT